MDVMSFILIAVSIGLVITLFVFRRHSQKQLAKKDEALQLKETEMKELRMLTAGVTHEINNAISIIMGRTEQLVKRNMDPLLDKGLDNIRNTSDRIVTSVKGLRQFLYPNTEEVEEKFELAKLMEDVLVLSGQRLRNHGVEIKLKGLEHKFIKGRRPELEQLMINLLNQSVERLDILPEKWVQIVAVEENGKLNIYFMDSSAEVGDKLVLKQYNDVLEKNHGHLLIYQNNIVLELPKPDSYVSAVR